MARLMHKLSYLSAVTVGCSLSAQLRVFLIFKYHSVIDFSYNLCVIYFANCPFVLMLHCHVLSASTIACIYIFFQQLHVS